MLNQRRLGLGVSGKSKGNNEELKTREGGGGGGGRIGLRHAFKLTPAY